jgi:hypothetical protein
MLPGDWSLIASVVSILLAVIAIGLSVWFFIEANKASKAASVTLGKVETLVATIQQHAFSMLELTLGKIFPRQDESSLIQPAISPPAPGHVDSGGKSLEIPEKPTSPLDEEIANLNKLYAALMQLGNPFVRMLGNITGQDFVHVEQARLRDLIALQRAKLAREYGVKFDDNAPERAKVTGT